MRNYITRAVGTEETIAVDITTHDRKQGDRWLICSDGMYGMVSKDELCRLIKTGNLEETAEHMLRAALEAGGKDNISLVLLQDETVFPEETPENENDGGTASEEVKPL
jgi:protein phosphatase